MHCTAVFQMQVRNHYMLKGLGRKTGSIRGKSDHHEVDRDQPESNVLFVKPQPSTLHQVHKIVLPVIDELRLVCFTSGLIWQPLEFCTTQRLLSPSLYSSLEREERNIDCYNVNTCPAALI